MGTAIKSSKSVQKKNQKTQYSYGKFSQLNGHHPLQESCPDSYITYKARKREGGKVTYFNFELAKEMGLIAKAHPDELTVELQQKILDTFAIVIINEYDLIHDIEFDEKDILPNEYMATRYLQLQHPNKQGKTSGDGRSIWNGYVKNRGKMWDVSSCGTGATCLSPATHIQNKYFQTGDPSISYGCGYSEVDEGFETLFFSEVLRKNSYSTERVLAIVEFENNLAINIRAHENLIRPSHMFNFLKQGNLDALKDIVNYYIDRQESNGEWIDLPKTPKARYRYFMNKQVEVFARLAARFEDDYIFCWLDWDGDNVLMDGGIIDYGSVRQFGLFHHEYRYDDIERYSTNIKEQKEKAKHTAKTFIQLVDFLLNGERTTLKDYDSDERLNRFEEIFEEQKNINILDKIGFSPKYRDYLLTSHTDLVEKFRNSFSYFERAKAAFGLHEVADGINWDAIFCMRDILREMPQIYLHRQERLTREEFIDIMKSSYAKEEDLAINSYRAKKIDEFQDYYMDMVEVLSSHFKKSDEDILLEVTMRSSVINKYDRVTGDSLSNIVAGVMANRKNFPAEKLYTVVQDFSEYQVLDPNKREVSRVETTSYPREMKNFLRIVREHREGL
jgi:hypothetical protein